MRLIGSISFYVGTQPKELNIIEVIYLKEDNMGVC